jgi:hypothetical protein
MVKQHDHAQLSGVIAGHFRHSLFGDGARVQDMLYAVSEHDRSWIRLDDTPIWNDAASAPFSFMDYPLLPKIALYKIGLDEIETANEYAALLCSLHYASFRSFKQGVNRYCADFYNTELARQERLKNKLNPVASDEVEKHFAILQLCDDISLYICLNRPGASKEEEHSWYRDGFANSERMDRKAGQPVVARWLDVGTIALTPSPLQTKFTATLSCKSVSKSVIRQIGIATAYKQADWLKQEVSFAE